MVYRTIESIVFKIRFYESPLLFPYARDLHDLFLYFAFDSLFLGAKITVGTNLIRKIKEIHVSNHNRMKKKSFLAQPILQIWPDLSTVYNFMLIFE